MISYADFEELLFILEKFMNHLWTAVISSQAWVAFNVALLCWYVQMIHGWQRPDLIWISFFATLFAYNLACWSFAKEEKFRWMIMVFSGVITVWMAISHLELLTLIILFLCGIISVLYAFPGKRNLRLIPGTKIYWIAFVWAATGILPWFESFDLPVWQVILQFLSLFCFITAITIPFDIRDVEMDADVLATLPQQMGTAAAVRLATQLLMVSGGLMLVLFGFELNAAVLSFLITILFAIWLVRKSLFRQNRWYTAFWLEGLSGLFWFIFQIML